MAGATEPQTTEAAKGSRFYVPQLDGLRFIAFLLVFLHHGQNLSPLLSPGSIGRTVLNFIERRGWLGVDLFLVLSAFLITSLLLIEYDRHRNISLRGFYMRRILRIWPLYYLMTMVGFFLLPWLSLFAMPLHSPEHAQLMREHFLAYCTLFGNYSSAAYSSPHVETLSHLWTVTLEEQFYLIWPVVLSLLLRARKGAIWVALSAMLIGTICYRAHLVGKSVHPYIWMNTLSRLDPLVVGIAIAFWRHGRPARPGWAIASLKVLLGLVAIALTNWGPEIQTQSPHIIWQFLATAVGCGLVLDAILSRGQNPLAYALGCRPLVWLGKLTYGLYVYHLLGIQIAAEVVGFLAGRHVITTRPGAMVAGQVFALIITIAIAAESYRLFESFFLRLKDRFSRVKSRPVEEAVANS